MRALDAEDLSARAFSSTRPTLDDVFLAKTGHRLEAEDTGELATAAPAPGAEPALAERS